MCILTELRSPKIHIWGNIILSEISNEHFINGLQREKTCLRWFANNTGADQPGHTRSMNSAFVIRFLESDICLLATGEILIVLASLGS